METTDKDKIRLSYNGYKFLVAITGYRLKPYRNSEGVYTVGLRHTGDDVIPGKIYTDDEIYDFFMEDVKPLEEDVRKIFDPRFMTQHMFDACVCFAYSIGNISTTDLGKMISKNPFDDRIRPTWEYTYTNGKRSKSLTKRRMREVEYYFREDE